MALVCLIIAACAACNRSAGTSGVNNGKETGTEKTAEKTEKSDKSIDVRDADDAGDAGNQELLTDDEKEAFTYYYDLAFKAHNKGEFGQAIDYYSKAIDQYPSHAESWLGRALSKYKSGNLQGACADLDRAVELGSSGAQGTRDSICQ